MLYYFYFWTFILLLLFFNTYEFLTLVSTLLYFNPHPRICLLILEREEGRERERNIDMRDIDRLLLYTPQLGIEPTT